MAASRGVGYRPMPWTLFLLCQLMIVSMVTACPDGTDCMYLDWEGISHSDGTCFNNPQDGWTKQEPSSCMQFGCDCYTEDDTGLLGVDYFNEEDCKEYDTAKGIINFENIYDAICWIIRIPSGKTTYITFLKFVNKNEFGSDYLTIRKDYPSSPIKEVDETTSMPYSISINSNIVYLKFTSNDPSTKTEFELLWTTDTPSSKGCKLGNKMYSNEDRLEGCTMIMCIDGNWITDDTIDKNCAMCKAYWDPHIIRFNGKNINFQYCGKYSLTQNTNSHDPQQAVYSEFKTCGGNNEVSCVSSVEFKNDGLPITIGYNTKIEITVNGISYIEPLTTTPTMVEVPGYPYTVLIWKWKDNEKCVNLQGSNGLFVRFCGHNRPEEAAHWRDANEVYVWANPSIVNNLKGLCGTINDDRYIDRDGTESSYNWEAPIGFAESWNAILGGNVECPSRKRRSIFKRQAQNICVNGNDIDDIKSRCITTILKGFPNVEPEEEQSLIDACVFDMCSVSDPDNWMKIVEETVKTMAVIQENTIVMPTPPPPPPPTQPSTPPKPSTTSLPTVMPTPPPTSPPTQLSTPPPTQPATSPPTGNWLAYQGKAFVEDPCVTISEEEVFTLQHCKSWCVYTADCNAIECDPIYNTCVLWHCPTPGTPPEYSISGINSYILLRVMATPPPTSPPTQPSTSPPTVMPTPLPTSPPTQLSTPPSQSSTSPPTEENEENLYIHVRQIVNNN